MGRNALMAKFSGSTKSGSTGRKTGEPTARPTKEAAENFAEGDLGKIQSLLFGEQTRKFDTELAALEASVTEMSTRMATELGNRISALEKDYNHRLEQLAKRIDDSLASLESDKVDKKVLADVLTKSATEIRKG